MVQLLYCEIGPIENEQYAAFEDAVRRIVRPNRVVFHMTRLTNEAKLRFRVLHANTRSTAPKDVRGAIAAALKWPYDDPRVIIEKEAGLAAFGSHTPHFGSTRAGTTRKVKNGLLRNH